MDQEKPDTNSATPTIPSQLAPIRDAIPSSLRGEARWVVWKLEARGGKRTKVPYQAFDATKRARSTDPSTWAGFDEAWATFERGAVDGIGFVLGDGVAGVDLDNCRNPETGALTTDAQRIIDALMSYSEVSPSGRGVKIYVRASERKGVRRKGLEIYGPGRYFAVTGARVAGARPTVEDREDQLAQLIAEEFPGRTNGATSIVGNRAPTILGDGEPDGRRILPGSRNNTLLSFAGFYRRKGLDEQEIAISSSRSTIATANLL
jgi:putative DNA primase/helicase